MTSTCCLDCSAEPCTGYNCRMQISRNAYAGWCSGSKEDREKCLGECPIFAPKRELKNDEWFKELRKAIEE